MLGEWREHSATLAPATRAKYRWALQHHLTKLVDEPLVTFDVALIAKHQRRLLDAGVAPSTVRARRLGQLGASFNSPSNTTPTWCAEFRKVRVEPAEEANPFPLSRLRRCSRTSPAATASSSSCSPATSDCDRSRCEAFGGETSATAP